MDFVLPIIFILLVLAMVRTPRRRGGGKVATNPPPPPKAQSRPPLPPRAESDSERLARIRTIVVGTFDASGQVKPMDAYISFMQIADEFVVRP